jgi:hypothetical protein
MGLKRQRRPDELVVSSGNVTPKRTLADVVKTLDTVVAQINAPGPEPIPPAEYSIDPEDLAAVLVANGMMSPEPEGE